ncbi:hypothetical protein SAMN05216214_11580 [Atopomonas hussainii]|uniref:Uncharacterized protein n=1 Tax=Atopomonas hussainii TaxID=1429083 RepID=A0A1H7RPX1_9GAMM|nr:hypothetical protein SAMN05216214_11580 [Atopomonas hussainii]
MEQLLHSESIVYGSIRDWPEGGCEARLLRQQHNARVLQELDGEAGWPFFSRGMFGVGQVAGDGLYQTQVISFGASYQAVEYEWSLWVEKFEALLRRLYWANAIVHLETELNGRHTFRWESDEGFHTPEDSQLSLRCEWEHEGAMRFR